MPDFVRTANVPAVPRFTGAGPLTPPGGFVGSIEGDVVGSRVGLVEVVDVVDVVEVVEVVEVVGGRTSEILG